jgi:hypothetical protein
MVIAHALTSPPGSEDLLVGSERSPRRLLCSRFFFYLLTYINIHLKPSLCVQLEEY